MGNILVLGASGFVGAAIKKRLEQENTVYGTYFHSKAAYETEARMEFLDVRDPLAPAILLQKTEPEWIISSLRGEFADQLAFHRQLAKEMKKLPNSRLCYISTANVFDKDGERPHYEEDEPEAESEYGRFKAECESMLMQELGERCMILRLPMVWGRDCPRIRSLYAGAAGEGRVQVWTKLYINIATDEQIAGYVSHIVNTGAAGIFHVGTDDCILHHELVRRIGEKLHLQNISAAMEDEEKEEYMVLFSNREDIPDELKLTVEQVIESIC